MPSLRIEPLTSAIAALIDGIDLAGRLADGEVRDLRTAIHRHRVVFLRGQQLTLEEHRCLGEQLGPLAVSPLHRVLGTGRTMSTIEDDAERPPAGFRLAHRPELDGGPPSLGILCAVEIPAVGGDTLWASLPAALAALPSTCRTPAATSAPTTRPMRVCCAR